MSDQIAGQPAEPTVEAPQPPQAPAPDQPQTSIDAPAADPLESRVAALENALGYLSSSVSSVSSTLGSLNNTTVPQLAARVAALEAAQAPSPVPAPSADTPAPAGDGPAPVVVDDPAQAIVARVDSGDRGPVVHQLGQMLGKAGYPNIVSQGQGDVFDASVASALASFIEAGKLTPLPLDSLITSEVWTALEQAAAATDAADAPTTPPTDQAPPDTAPQQEATP